MGLPKTIDGFRLHNPNFLNIKIDIKRLTKKRLLTAMDKIPYMPRPNTFYEVYDCFIFLSILGILYYIDVK
jgi:hypothetical protein